MCSVCFPSIFEGLCYTFYIVRYLFVYTCCVDMLIVSARHRYTYYIVKNINVLKVGLTLILSFLYFGLLFLLYSSVTYPVFLWVVVGYIFCICSYLVLSWLSLLLLRLIFAFLMSYPLLSSICASNFMQRFFSFIIVFYILRVLRTRYKLKIVCT
jgi:hypothetical protein